MTEQLAAEAAPDRPEPLLDPLVVHRSTLRTWLIALAGVPALVIGIDVLWRQRIIGWLSDFVYESDPERLDARDEIWAWAMLVVGGLVLAWGLKELFMPSPVLRTDDEGVHVRMGGPLRPATSLGWFSLYDLDAGTLEDDEEDVEVLIIEVKDPSLLPANPWGGRRFDERTVAMFTREWDRRAEEVAVDLADQAITVARHRPAP